MTHSVSSEPVPQALLTLARPSRDDLLELLTTRVSRLMLEEISANDYGEETTAHLDGIESQLRLDAPLGRLDLCPLEVLELERWSEPDVAVHGAQPEGERDTSSACWHAQSFCGTLDVKCQIEDLSKHPLRRSFNSRAA
jgi:hypothetical protein